MPSSSDTQAFQLPESLPPAERDVTGRLRQEMAEVLSFSDEVLRNDLGPFSLEEGRFWFERTQAILKLASDGPLQELLRNRLNEILSAVANVKNALETMRAFDPTKPEPPSQNPVERKQSLLNSLRDNCINLHGVLLPALPYLMLRSVDLVALQAASQSQIQSLITTSKNELDQAQEQAKQTLDALRTAAGQTGVSKYATVFQNEANSHSRHSWGWAIAATVFGAIAAEYTILSVEPHIRAVIAESEKTSSPGLLIPLAISRLILVSILYVALVWCLRNFSASRHNAVVNRHRQNALSTFEAFVKAAEGDAQTKNAVLLQATQSIFSPQSSGYLKADNEAPSAGPVLGFVQGLSKEQH